MDDRKRLRNQILVSIVCLIAVIAIASTVAGVRLYALQEASAQQGASAQETKAAVAEAQGVNSRASMSSFAFIAAAVAFGLGAIGAGLAIGNVGAAAMGAVAEKPEIAGQALIFVALAEGLVVFGFITALMILGKV